MSSEIYTHSIHNSKGVLVKSWQAYETEEGESRLHGFWRTWDESGTLLGECFYEHGEPEGYERRWHSRNVLASIGCFQDGSRAAPLVLFSKDGSLAEIIPFQQGTRKGLGLHVVDEETAEVIEYGNTTFRSLGKMPLAAALSAVMDSIVLSEPYLEVLREHLT